MSYKKQLYKELYLAYLEARKNKRSTHNQLCFELNLETNLYSLAEAIYNQTYAPKPSIAFMIFKPVQREIFAADFADRVVHHLIYRCIYYQYIDPYLIQDSYSCRKGKGTLYGIKRIDYFIRSCTQNYANDAHILKVDVKGYFMNMQHKHLYKKVVTFLDPNKTYRGLSYQTITFLIYKTIYANVATNCRIKGLYSNWDTLPKDKSLFNKPKGIGLPIGNLTSQFFGNVYLDALDKYIKNNLGITYYGRYVDDMVLIHNSKKVLQNAVPNIKTQLAAIGLTLHPKKVYLQHYTKGVLFLGHYIKPYRHYISNRTKSNFYKAITQVNALMQQSFIIQWQTMLKIRALLNAYLGLLQHAKTYNLIQKAFLKLNNRFFHFFGVTKNYSKVYIKKDYWLWHYTQTYQFIS